MPGIIPGMTAKGPYRQRHRCVRGRSQHPSCKGSLPALRQIHPHRPVRVLIALKRFGGHFDAVTGALWWHVAPTADYHRIEKVFVQMVDVFQYTVLERSADRDVIEH